LNSLTCCSNDKEPADLRSLSSRAAVAQILASLTSHP
jgi:hypothetical protein